METKQWRDFVAILRTFKILITRPQKSRNALAYIGFSILNVLTCLINVIRLTKVTWKKNAFL